MNTITRYKNGVVYSDPVTLLTESYCRKINGGKDNIKPKDSAKRKVLMAEQHNKVQITLCNNIDKNTFLLKKAVLKKYYKTKHKNKFINF